MRSLLIALGATLVLLACSDGGDDKGPHLRVAQWPVSFGRFAPPSAGEDEQQGTDDDVPPAESQDYALQVWNDGGGVLEITAVELRGDVNCSIQTGPEFDLPLPVQLTHTDQAFLRWVYLPGGSRNAETGGDIKDQISIELTTNSSDSTQFEISTCGCIVAPGEGLEDLDPACDEPCCCNLNEVPPGNCGG